MRKIKEVIVVEGKYDKNALSQVVDATIIETDGFQIFSRRDQISLLRRLAEERGLILMTDSDGAGFVIRNFLKGTIPKGQIKQAYIPDRRGKEKRKQKPGKEGKLGVEGMPPSVLLESLIQSGATFSEEGEETAAPKNHWSKADLYENGLLGQPESKNRRRRLLHMLDLPEHLSTNALLDMLNILYSTGELEQILRELGE
jgi:ribonuclease M5